MQRRLLTAFALVGLVPVAATAQAELSSAVREMVAVDASVVALTHVQVVDGTGASPSADQTVVIVDGVIESVQPAGEANVPDAAEVLDLTGHTVIPGFVGLHDHTLYTTRGRRVHLTYSAPRLYLGSGVTTIRTTGSYQPYEELNLKQAIEAGETPGPRIHVTGPHLTGASGSSRHVKLEDVEAARRVAAYWVEEGATWLKVYNQVSRAQLLAITEAAHARGAKVTGHLCSVTFREAVAAGIDNIEHGFLTNTDYMADKEPDACPSGYRAGLATLEIDPEAVDRTFDEMIAAGVPMTSTLVIYESFVPDRPVLQTRALDAMAPGVRAEVEAAHGEIQDNAASSVWPELFARALAYEKRFVDAGGLLVAGSDPTGYGAVLHGFGDQRNYELLLEAGFAPTEAIRIMTLNGATVLGEADQYGSIEPGKLAEIVVIEGDPIAHPAEIRNVRLVFKGGLGYDANRLIKSVEGVVGVR